ncbi:MAG: hypothetical protein DRN07_08375, partial [Thermoplasmata archaeon]
MRTVAWCVLMAVFMISPSAWTGFSGIENSRITPTNVTEPLLVIDEISGGFGLSVVIRNTGTEEAYDVKWSAEIDSDGLMLFGTHREGVISSIAAGESSVITCLFFGVGPAKATVTAEDFTRTALCFFLGPFVPQCLMQKTREEAIPDDAVKMTPETDVFPPVLHSDAWEEPVPMEGPVNTAGAEDSPFITPDGSTFFFFFTPDVEVPPEKQLIDGATGIWWSKKESGIWGEPERIVLHYDVSLDGAPFVEDNTMWFASARSGNYGELDFYIAHMHDGTWTDVTNAGEQLNQEYDVGELHITADGTEMYCGRGDGDIYVLQKTADGWSEPMALPSPVNTPEYSEDQPFITSDGNELWFTGQSRLGYPGPAVFRSVKTENGSWSEPEEIISQFAGEPALDAQGNVYFVHHFFSGDMKMIEA